VRAALTSTAAGLAVTAIGIVALVAMFGSSSSVAPTAVPPTPTAATAPPIATPSTTSTSEGPFVVAVPAPTPDLAGVGSAVGRVLYANGYATNNNPEKLAGDLPPSVVALLIEREVTLAVATEADGAGIEEVAP
jgi:hypothetical protein